MTAAAGSTPLSDAAYAQIRNDIIECRLAPGTRLTERGLAADRGFGISPIRDALIRLDHEGLVRTLPRKGYQVKPLTIKIVDDLFEYWTILGPEVARRGVKAATDEQLQRIVDDGEAVEKLARESGYSWEVTRRTIEAIHYRFGVLAEATRNDYLINASERLSGELSRVWILVINSEMLDLGGTMAPVEQWKPALLRRDGDRFAEMMREYVQQSHSRVLSTLARWPSVIETEVAPLHQIAR